MTMRITAVHFTDPGCPWAYSARPYHARLRWRFGDQLDWQLVTIGLAESAQLYIDRGYTPAVQAAGARSFATRFGMPFQYDEKPAISATSLGCRALVLVREDAPDRVDAALRALQLMQFTTLGLLEDPQAIREALATVDGIDADAVVARLDAPATWERYDADRAQARSAEGAPTHVQRRTAKTDGLVRYTAPSVRFLHPDGRSGEVGGFQPFEAYDTILANLEPGLTRQSGPEGPLEVLAAFPDGLVTAEVAEVLREELDPRDVPGTRAALAELASTGAVQSHPVGDDAVWTLAP
ncbi:unannotated protein [freshwater metagenome]|uniref:Unannotated protein n=1 Tax=freshwater metagenome TaxID=449393 RepID=A0A6J7HRE7_9ZZZZ|nr:hypothetical protein [Actinomycetota bacterium]